jgi:release factor glutamine methyltransferase
VVTSSSGSVGTVTARLAAAGCVAAAEEAIELVAVAPDVATLEAMVARREQGEPLAWITGVTEFCGHQVRIDTGVYIPRRQTEELVHRAVAILASKERSTWVADLCTGSGAIAVALKASVPGARVVAVDSDLRAVRCAHRNGVSVALGDLGQPLMRGTFEVVTAVAPYVPTADIRFLPRDVQRFEPRHALDGGSDGLDLVRRIVASSAELLRPGGWLLTELGGEQHLVLAPILDAFGFGSIVVWRDEEDDLRGVAARRRSLT